MRRQVAVLSFALTLASIAGAGAQTPAPRPSPVPLVPFHVAINATTLAGLPRITVSATDEAGHTNKYSGFSLRDLLVRNGMVNGQAVRGKAMLAYVLVSAADDYHVIFTLPEIDASYTDHVVVIADQKDGAPFTGDTGPYRLITPFDKREARWVREVTGVDLKIAPAP